MGINNLITWVLIDPVMADNYNRNVTLVGSVLLLKRRAHRLAFELRRGIGWGSHLNWNAELAEVWVGIQSWLQLVFAVGTQSWLRSAFAIWNAELAEVRVCSWMWGPHFVLKRDLRVGMRFAPKDLSSIKIRQPTELPPKFSKLRGRRFSKYFELHVGSNDWTDNLVNCSELDLVWILVFVSVLLNYLKPPGIIIVSI